MPHYIVKQFTSVMEMESFLNEHAKYYWVAGFSETVDNFTIILERNGNPVAE